MLARGLGIGGRVAAAVAQLHPEPRTPRREPPTSVPPSSVPGVFAASMAAVAIGRSPSPRRDSGCSTASGPSPSAASAEGSSTSASAR